MSDEIKTQSEENVEVSDETLNKEIEEMLAAANVPLPEEKKEKEDEAGKGEEDGEKETDEDQEEATNEEAAGAEEETGEETEEDEGGDTKDDEIAALKEMVKELTQTVKELAKPKEEKKEEIESEVLDFIGDQDLDELLGEKEQLNALLNKVFQMGQEAVMKRIPSVIEANVTYTTTMKEATDNFYSQNEDLVPWKKTVAAVAMEMLDEDPSLNKDLNTLLDKVGKEVRARLGLKGKSGKKESKRRVKDPGFAKPPRGAREPSEKKGNEDEELSEVEKELLQMNKALGKL